MRRGLVIMVAATLAACGADKEVREEPNVFPKDFKSEIAAQMPKLLEDPSNIRNAVYSDPVLDPAGAIKVYYSCVRFNPRGPNKQYLGDQEYIAFYYAGQLNQFRKAEPQQCGKAAYKPFPELEKLCAGQSCVSNAAPGGPYGNRP